MLKMKILALCLSAFLVVGLLGMDIPAAQNAGGYEMAAAQAGEQPVSGIAVNTIMPEVGNITVIGEYMGTVEPFQQVAVIPKAAGEVLAVHFDVGDTVKAGDILFEIDSTILEYTIAQTEAAVNKAKASAQAGLSSAQAGLSAYDRDMQKAAQSAIDGAESGKTNAEIGVDAARSRRSQAKAALDTAKRQLKDFEDDVFPLSVSSLLVAPATKPSELDDTMYKQLERQFKDAIKQAQAAYDQADLGVDQARAARDAAELGVARAYENAAELTQQTQRTQMAGQVRLAEIGTNFEDQDIALERLYNDLDNYRVVAPIDGIIEMRNVDPFGMASQAAPAFIISDMSSVVVTYKVTRESREVMYIGDRVEVEDSTRSYFAYVTEISTAVDMSGLFTVKATIYGAPPNLLFTGITLRVYATIEEAEDAVTVPLSALYYERGVPYVFKADGSTARKIPVEVGLYDAERAQIIEGVELTDSIISTWSHNMADGAEIVVVG